MARPSGPKTRNGGEWTESRFNSFIKSLLRQGTQRWGPINEAKKAARISRGLYECAGCHEKVHPTVRVGSKRVKNIVVDHIQPIIDPEVGFTTWDDCIQRMFCEADNLQVLCKACHDVKSKEERDTATERRKNNKDDE